MYITMDTNTQLSHQWKFFIAWELVKYNAIKVYNQ